MSSSNFASSFAPYTPPPDDPIYQQSSPASSSKAPARTRPWFPSHPQPQSLDPSAGSSYQSGAIPTFGTSAAGGAGAAEEAEGQVNMWETHLGARVDMLAAWAYILGPITAFGVLVLETQNDYVRFHAYQSALLTTPLIVFRIFASLVGFTPWLRTILTLFCIIPAWAMAFRAHRDANRNNLARYQLPYIGPLADQWVSEE